MASSLEDSRKSYDYPPLPRLVGDASTEASASMASLLRVCRMPAAFSTARAAMRAVIWRTVNARSELHLCTDR
jgi:hypothetical protein